MLTAILLLCCLKPDQCPRPPQGPPLREPPAACRCGDNCPLKGACGDNCGCAAIPARPDGPGWAWDARGKVWWRYVTVPTVPRSHTPAAPIPGFSAFGPATMALQSLTRHAPAYYRGAASCAT